MKISTVKSECSDGNKVDISGKVVWNDPKGKREVNGKSGPIYFEKCLITDGPKDDRNSNSMFCEFYDEAPRKGSNVSLQGAVHLYNGEKSLQGCKLTGGQSAPQTMAPAQSQAASSGKQEPDWDLKDFRIILQCCSKPFAEAQAAGKMSFDEAVVNMKSWANEVWNARPSVVSDEDGPDYTTEDTTDYSQEPDWMK